MKNVFIWPVGVENWFCRKRKSKATNSKKQWINEIVGTRILAHVYLLNAPGISEEQMLILANMLRHFWKETMDEINETVCPKIARNQSLNHEQRIKSSRLCQKGAGKGSAGAVGSSQKTGPYWVGFALQKRLDLPSIKLKFLSRWHGSWHIIIYTSQGFCYSHGWRRDEVIASMEHMGLWRELFDVLLVFHAPQYPSFYSIYCAYYFSSM